VKLLAEVDDDKSITIKTLPFKPGSRVEVIVLPVEEEDVFARMDSVVKTKGIPHMRMKEIEKIDRETFGPLLARIEKALWK
jgi:hypothetical protein